MKIEQIIEKEAIAAYLGNAEKFAQNYQMAFPQKLNAYFGVLCFSTSNDSLLMWAHYADSHKGFVLEFETEDNEFKELGDLYEVKYNKARPILDPAQTPTMEVYMRKGKEWEYEHEYRLVRSLPNCEKRLLADGEFYFVRMSRSCVKALYLGSRMDKFLATQISQIMAGTDAEIYQTELHLKEFGLVFNRIK